MIIDLIKIVIGVLPPEYEFIYYVLATLVSIFAICIPLYPIIAIFKSVIGGRR